MDRMSSIELALKNEEAEMKFYQHEAARSRNPLAKAIFETLAKDEAEHMKRIRGLHQRLLSQGSWPNDVALEVAGTNVAAVLDGVAKQSGAAADHDDDDLAALKKSAGFEANGARFYRELTEACTNPMEKKFFAFLSDIEREHLRSVEGSIEYLNDPEGWMMHRGKGGLDGA